MCSELSESASLRKIAKGGNMRGLAIALEAVGIVAIVIGIAIEAVMRADIGFIAITGGSAIIATGGLLWAKVMRKK